MNSKKKRLLSLDVFRGLTIALMILVNNPGSWSHVYSPLLHSKWDGCTPTDLVFPFFMFCVGTAMWYSFKRFDYSLSKEASKKIITRTCLMFGIGLFLNVFPFTSSPSDWRIMGVLQRIALAYCISSFVILGLGRKKAMIFGAISLLGYWGILALGGQEAFTLEGNLVRTIDLALLGESHIYGGYGIPFDPEGLLSTLPSVSNILIGYYVGYLISQKRALTATLTRLVGLGASLVLLGLLWGQVFAINKPLWSSSYVFYTCGWAILLLSLLYYLIDIKEWKGWAMPFYVFGMNSLAIYVFAGLFSRFLSLVSVTGPGGDTISLHYLIYQFGFVQWTDALNGSLLFGLSFILLCWGIVLILYKRNIFLKI